MNRYIVFGGLGNAWRDTEDLVFRTSYGVGYTDREEDVPDPEKDRRFQGARLSDGIPGNGDEFFQTVESAGVEVEVGEDRIRKESSDFTFRTSLMITL